MLNFLLFLSLFRVINGGSEDIEIVFLPSTSSEIEDEVALDFIAFGHTIELKLQKNDKLLAPSFQIWRHNDNKIAEWAPELSDPTSCHYLHADSFRTAAISFCDEGFINGLVLLDNAALEITPLRETNYPKFFNRSPIYNKTRSLSGSPHIVKRSYLSSISSDTSGSYVQSNEYIKLAEKMQISEKLFSRPDRSESSKELAIELAVFFDEAAYNIFSPFFDGDERKIRDMLLAYINGVQALYFHPSLGPRIEIVLVRLDIMQRQPQDLPHYNGERGHLLNSFCAYAQNHNLDNDNNPHHWDIGLYVSGLDFYANEDGSRVTMGLAPVNGTCFSAYSCVIAELGVTNRFGKPYPSAGFTSVYIAAHEIGHNLGMRHDSVENTCAKDGYIMSPSRGSQGETIWSSCSRDIALKLRQVKPCLHDRPTLKKDHSLDHERYLTLPGREWTSKRQCEFFLRDKDAVVVTLTNACQALQCKSPHRSTYYYAGPALDGTSCAQGKECRGGECVPALQTQQQRPYEEKPEIIKEGWSMWSEEACTSGCIKNSKGARARRRICYESTNKKKKLSCSGYAYDVQLCEDNKLCKKRVNVEDFAATKCRQFSEHLNVLDADGGGLQAPHETTRPWMGCAIFCRRNDIASYYTPRIELNDLGLDPYFPDGTWCHNENGDDYFCLRHHCLPENFRFGKDSSISRYDNTEDNILGPQNARPEGYEIPDEIVKYLSLGIDGLPLSRTVTSKLMTPPNEDAWIDKDYVELPDNPNLSINKDYSLWSNKNDNSMPEEIIDNHLIDTN